MPLLRIINALLAHSEPLIREKTTYFAVKHPDKDMKKAIVMGATSGIGMEVAKLLAAKGWLVGIAGRRTERLEQLAAETEGIACYRRIDITDANATQELDALIAELGGMDLYFHSSGVGWQNLSLDAARELDTLEINGMGFTRMLTAVFNRFTEQGGGHIACISSIAGTKGLGAAPAYSATKRFQNHYMECLSQMARLRRVPITITDIRPGFVATDLIADRNYPMQLRANDVARSIVRAVERRRSVVVIDWRYRLLTAFWRLIPRWLWVRLRIK